MKDNRFSMLCVAAVVVGAVCATAQATLPDDRTIRYEIRAIPSDPESDVIFTITLELSADQLDGDAVGWQINEVRFVRTNDNAEWIEPYVPAVQPSLWWVDHADHHAPQLSEFAVAPLLDGTAVAMAPADPDLDYRFVGARCDEACQGMHNGNVAALDVVLWSVQEAEPAVDDEDEPVEIDNGEG